MKSVPRPVGKKNQHRRVQNYILDPCTIPRCLFLFCFVSHANRRRTHKIHPIAWIWKSEGSERGVGKGGGCEGEAGEEKKNRSTNNNHTQQSHTTITNNNHKQQSMWKPTIQQDLLHACSTVRGGQPIAAIAVRKHVAVVPGCFVVPSLVGSFVAPKPGVFRRSKSIQHLLRKGRAEGQC